MGFMKRKYNEFILWFVSGLFVWFVAIFIGFGMRQRMSHNKGVAGRGKLRIVDNPKFPDHDFFTGGREFSCRVRHASVTFFDDVMNQVRGISLKFADSNYKSPLDLEANTGRISIFWTTANFIKFVWNRRQSGGIQYKAYYKKEPDGKKGAQVSGKHKPSSFAKLDYYSKTPMNFTDIEGNHYYVKYRIIPGDAEIEMAEIPAEKMSMVHDQRVAENESMSVNYLVQEYKDRLRSGPVNYKLQMQLHNAEVNANQSIFDSRIEWGESTHPWLDVAHVEINEVLPYEQMVKMAFNIGHHPKSLGFIKALSIHDYNSIVYMRSKVKPAYHTRLLSYKLFGLPVETPDDAPRNQ